MWNRLCIILLISLLIDGAIPRPGRGWKGFGDKGRGMSTRTEMGRDRRSWAPRNPSLPRLPPRPGLPPHRRPRLRSPPRPRMPLRPRGFGGRPRPKPIRPSKSRAGAARGFRV